MKILIKNGNLISMSDDRDKIEYGVDVLIDDGKIVEIGKNISSSYDKLIDASDRVVMPGLINTHSHIPMSIFRETVDGLTTQDWLEKRIWPMEDKLNEDDIYWATMLSGVEMISTGCTTINDMYFMTDSIIKAAVDCGIRLQTTRTLMGNDSSDHSRIEELKELLNNYKGIDTVSFNCGIHGFYTSSLDYIKECVDFADDNNLIINIHFCENQEERETIIEEYGVSQPASLIKKHFKSIHNIIAHAVKLSDDDIDILKDTHTYVSHCPISNLRLGCGVAPVVKMMDSGICVSLGTDGQGSGTNLDMFEVMKYTALMHKGFLENPVVMDAYQVLKMATVNGARTLGLDNIGSIEVGKSADMIIVDMTSILTKPVNDIFSQLVYNTKGSDVNTTIINGKFLMEDRVINHINRDEIINKCEDIIKRVNV